MKHTINLRSAHAASSLVVVTAIVVCVLLLTSSASADNSAHKQAASPIANTLMTADATVNSGYTLSTLKGIMSPYAGIRSVATTIDADGVTTHLYFSTLLAANSSVSEYKLSGDVVVPIVQSTQYSNCLDANVNEFTSSNYPITPNGIAVVAAAAGSVRRATLLIADRTPSTHIYAVNSTSSSFTPATSTYSQLVGPIGCSANVSALADGASVTSNMMDATYIAVDSTSGSVYFTQRHAVFTLPSTSSATVSYYFGNENIPGDRSTESYNAINRLAARTEDPAQIFIDQVDSTMYVAEMGMGTVRQINMLNGNASVVVGQFRTLDWPPASCTPSAPCAKSDVTFVAVTAVALYRPRAVSGQRWLFVGDFTAAVVYKIVLETGVATVVAGQMLSFGRKDGVSSVSQLFAPRSFAVGVSSIYIADNSLRVLQLYDNPTPAPPVISPTVVTTTSNTVTGAIIVGGIINPTVATQASRANVLIALARCERNFGQLDPFSHILQFPVGDDEDFQYFAGAVVGNISLCLGTLLINALVLMIYARVAGKSLGSSASTMKFPSFVSLPLLFVLNPTISVGVSLMAYATTGWLVAIGVVGFLASLIAFAVVTIYFVFYFDGHDDFEMLEKKFSGVFGRMVNPVGEWLQTDLTGRMGMFFEDYLPSCWWFVIVELGMCLLSGIIEGIRPAEQSNCIIAIALASTLYTAFFVAMVLWQPYTIRIVFYLRATIALLQVISAYLSLVAVKTIDADWEAASVAFALMSMYLAGVDALISILLAIRDLVHLFQDAPEHQARRNAALKVHSSTSSDDGDNNAEFSELLEIPLISGSFAYRASSDTSIVHVSEDGHRHGMPPRQSSSSSSEEEDERRRKLKANRHEVLRNELTGLMNASTLPLSQQNDDGSPPLLRNALATGDYFLNVGDTRTPTPSLLRVKTISPTDKRRQSSSESDDDDEAGHVSPPPPSMTNYSFVVGNSSGSNPLPPTARTAATAASSNYLSVPQHHHQHHRTLTDNSSSRSSRSNATNSSFGL
ncbi:membrane-associated protein, putative [Bodo saltans]|uniref:Membrane-associated protein, putative n=1 Tax=Bodo saltans TaxID=75058 RepID=A0A0S4JAN2_BODSA|nr:membrane-associated protein, putative [Bodo saltans]|eukprot:CUG87055.1 membrane-associated protein, putative [Bodo saltans]